MEFAVFSVVSVVLSVRSILGAGFKDVSSIALCAS